MLRNFTIQTCILIVCVSAVGLPHEAPAGERASYNFNFDWKSHRVAIVIEIGTTPSTIKTLDVKIAPMFAVWNASMKLCQCGCAGHSRPLGYVPDGWRAVVNRLANGTSVTAATRTSNAPPDHTFRRTVIRRPPSG